MIFMYTKHRLPATAGGSFISLPLQLEAKEIAAAEKVEKGWRSGEDRESQIMLGGNMLLERMLLESFGILANF